MPIHTRASEERALVNLLDGICIVDFTHVHAGPLCTYQLALMGAEVIKVEVPGTGDLMRTMGEQLEPGISAGYLGQNANKRSVVVDLKHPGAKPVVERLLGAADVVVQNMRPGGAERLGIGPAEARAAREDVVYCAISGFGQTGPESNRPALDHLMQGESGMFHATGMPHEPVRVGYAAVDSATALVASSAIASALLRRERTGEGALLDVSMLESAVAVMGLNYYNYLGLGRVGERVGRNPLARVGSVGTFDTTDGIIMVNANSYRLFERLAHAVGRGELLEDPRFSTPAAAAENWEVLRSIFEAVFRTRTAEVWDRLLRDAGIPSGRVKDPEAVMGSAQLAHRGTVATLSEVPGAPDGELRFVGAGFTVDSVPAVATSPPPRLGENTTAVLRRLAFSNDEIRALLAQGAVHEHPRPPVASSQGGEG